MYWDYLYQLKKGKWKRITLREGTDEEHALKPADMKWTYYEKVSSGAYYYSNKIRVNGKKATVKKYKATVSRLLKGNTEKKIHYHANTEENREKYLK